MNILADKIIDLLRCPACGHDQLDFEAQNGSWAICDHCLEEFTIIDGIPFLCIGDIVDLIRRDGSESLGDEQDGNEIKRANVIYHNEFAESYEQDVSTYDMFQDGGPCQQRLDGSLAGAAARAGGGVLVDVCCGTGNVLSAAQEYFDTLLGIDLSTSMMKIARGRGLEVLGGDATNLPIKDKSADCVTAFSALHHVLDYEAMAAEMARILKPGGTFYSDWDPNGHVTHTGWAVSLATGTLKALRRLTSKANIPETPLQNLAEYHHHSEDGFDGKKIWTVLEKAGFSKVEVYYPINPPSFGKTSSWGLYGWFMAALKIVSFIAPTSRKVLPYVAVVAVK